MTTFHITLGTGHLLSLRQGDITTETADAIVSAANNHLQHTAGVAGAIAARGGSAIDRESRRIGYVDTGATAVTGAGKLAARFVIHAVGPRWNEHPPEENDRLLASATTASLEAARERGCLAIAFPAIASGTFGFPKNRCARVMLATVCTWADAHPHGRPRYIRFTIIDAETVTVFTDVFRAWFGVAAAEEEEKK